MTSSRLGTSSTAPSTRRCKAPIIPSTHAGGRSPCPRQCEETALFKVTKTYGHELGLSACFRQWRATSHCRYLHGYPLSFKFTFEAKELDENNWVLDFGGLKEVKAWLAATFDHKLLIAEDDPQRERLEALGKDSVYQTYPGNPGGGFLADTLVIPFVGCEGFAKYVHSYVSAWLYEKNLAPRVRLASVEVREHGGNSAIYESN